MELVYLYMGDFNRPIKNIGMNYSNNFKADYCSENKTLSIENVNNPTPLLYGDNVMGIKIISGKNGTGKSTILKLLAMPKSERLIEFSPKQNTNQLEECESDKQRFWFALYHIKGDLFSIEGYRVDALNFLSGLAGSIDYPYSVVVQYDFDQSTAKFKGFLQDFKTDCLSRVQNHLFYLFYQNSINLKWYSDWKELHSEDTGASYLFERIVAKDNGYSQIVKYLYYSYHQEDFAKRIGTCPGAEIDIKIKKWEKKSLADGDEIDDFQKELDGERIAAASIYGKNIKLIDPDSIRIHKAFGGKNQYRWTNKKAVIISYLEEFACQVVNRKDKDFQPQNTIIEDKKDQDEFEWRKKHLLSVIKDNVEKETDYSQVDQCVRGLDKIPETFYSDNGEIVIPICTMENIYVDDLMNVLDENLKDDESHDWNQRAFIKVSFCKMSTGEAYFINLYASIYNSISHKKCEKEDTCVLILDEPDVGFHPEWTRSLIKNLVDFLNGEMSVCKYQVIIATHSPLILSDVQGKDIIRLKKENEAIRIYNKNEISGLLNGINEILVGDYFIDSLFGAFSEDYVNKILEEINNIKDELRKKTPDYVSLRSRCHDCLEETKIIGDRIVKKSIESVLQQVESKINYGEKE